MDVIARLALMSNMMEVPVGAAAAPDKYRTVRGAQGEFQPQGRGITATSPMRLGGPVKVLQARAQLQAAFEDVAGGGLQAVMAKKMPPMMLGTPAQIEGDHVRVQRTGVNTPLLRSDSQGRLSGDQGVIQSYTTAARVHSMTSAGLGRDFTYAGGQKLTVSLSAPSAMGIGPHYKTGLATVSLPGDRNAERDADVVSHEAGHAILDSQRPYLERGGTAAAVHEAFGDGTSLFTALKDPSVRRDVIDRRKAGHPSNAASSLGEGYQQTIRQRRQAGGDPLPKVVDAGREGIRDMSREAPKGHESTHEDPHVAGEQFGTALYRNVINTSDALKKENPKLSDDEALKQASEKVGSAFTRALDFLPVRANVGQGDLARAMIKADKIDNGGRLGETYAANFKQANVEVDDFAYIMKERRVETLASDPSLRLPKGLAESNTFKQAAGAPRGVANEEAERYLKANAAKLGLPNGDLRAHEMYRNDRGETFIHFSNGADRYDLEASEHAAIGFDKFGRVMHVDSGMSRSVNLYNAVA